jgi:CheY-like chemotaxis protein
MSGNFTPYALVVDDDALIRMDASVLLEDAGFRVFEAKDVTKP